MVFINLDLSFKYSFFNKASVGTEKTLDLQYKHFYPAYANFDASKNRCSSSSVSSGLKLVSKFSNIPSICNTVTPPEVGGGNPQTLNSLYFLQIGFLLIVVQELRSFLFKIGKSFYQLS